MNKIALLFLAWTATSFSVLAETRTWLSGATGDFNAPENWKNNEVPGTNDIANMSGGSATISEGMNISVNYLNIARTNTFDVVQTGGSLTVLSTSGSSDPGFKVARGEDKANTGAIGSYTLSGGTVFVPDSRVSIGNNGVGTMTISGTGKLVTRYRVVLSRLEHGVGTLIVANGGTIIAPVIELLRLNVANLTFDGGTYCATNTSGYSTPNDMFLAGASGTYVTIGDGGAVFDTAGYDCTISLPLVAPPDGVQGGVSPAGIEKTGAGILRLTATNTYAGPTIVSAGTLVAETPAALPNYATAGMVTVKSGARLLLGSAWTETEATALRASAVIEAGALLDRGVYDTSSGDITVSENLNLTAGLEKYGANTLFLTGVNTLGGNAKVHAGTLQADFGQGLDANYAVELLGGALSSANGSITAGIGTGAGQIALPSGCTPAFTAKGVPLTVKLGNTDNPISFGSALYPATSLILNTAEANQKITFANSLNVNGKTASITVNKGNAAITGMLTNSTPECTLEKRGSGTLSLEGPIQIRRLNTHAGTTILNTQTANVFGMLNVNDGSLLTATNQTISVTQNLNVVVGTLLLKDCAVTNVQSFTTGNSEANNAKTKKVIFDGGTAYGKTLYAGSANCGNGEIEIGNGANLSFDKIYVRGGTITQNGGTITGRNGGDTFHIGQNTNGTYLLNNGILNSSYHFQVGLDKGLGVVRQKGGTNTVLGVCSIGWGANSTGEVYVTGGVLREPVAKNFRVGEGGVGYLEVSEKGEVQTGETRLSLAHEGNTGAAGRVLLGYGGTIEATTVAGNNGKNGCYSEFFFNGGTLRATTTAPAKYLYNLTAFGMGELGGTIDTNGRDLILSNALTATSSVLPSGVGLTHRWSFNGDLKDSIGGQDATAYVYMFTNGNSELALTPAEGSKKKSYVNLGSNILPRDGSAATIEVWATQREDRSFSRIFDIGVNGNDYLTMSWTKSGGINTDMIRIRNGEPSVSDKMAPYTLGTEFHIAFVLEPLPNDGRWVATAYKQDATTGETLKTVSFTNETWTLPSLAQTYCYLGRSVQSDNDAAANYNEMRVWNRALSEEELTANALAGPDALPLLTFVKKGAGRLTLTGANTYAVDTRVESGTLALGANSSLPSSTGVELVDGATLALGGNSQTVASLTGEGTVSGGTLVVTGEINPGTNATEAATLTFNDASVSGTLTLDATENEIDSIECTSGVFDLSGLTLQINNLEALTGASYTLATSVHGLSGQFAGANVANTPWRISYSANAVKLSRGGTIFMVR